MNIEACEYWKKLWILQTFCKYLYFIKTSFLIFPSLRFFIQLQPVTYNDELQGKFVQPILIIGDQSVKFLLQDEVL